MRRGLLPGLAGPPGRLDIASGLDLRPPKWVPGVGFIGGFVFPLAGLIVAVLAPELHDLADGNDRQRQREPPRVLQLLADLAAGPVLAGFDAIVDGQSHGILLGRWADGPASGG